MAARRTPCSPLALINSADTQLGRDLRNTLMTLIGASSEAAMRGKPKTPPKPSSWSSCKTHRHVDFDSIKLILLARLGSSLRA